MHCQLYILMYKAIGDFETSTLEEKSYDTTVLCGSLCAFNNTQFYAI